MSEQTKQKIQRLQSELNGIMCCYSSAKACQQDKMDDRIGQIDNELKVLRAS